MIQTLPTWKSQHAANTLSHNDVVRLLGDANEEIERLRAEHYRVSEDGRQLFLVIAGIAESLGIYGSAPYLCQETGTAVKQLVEERDALRAALQPFADAAQYVDSPMYTADRYVAGLNTVEQYHNARRVLGEVKE